MKRFALGFFASAAVILLGGAASAQNTIKVGVPMPLSGPAALYGEPAVKGARMFVDEINAAGGVLGKKIELIVRDSKASADEAVRVSREMILKEDVQFLVGTLTSAEGPAVSTIAKQDNSDCTNPQDGSADRTEEPSSLCFPHCCKHNHGRALGSRDHCDLEGRKEGRHHRA
jgi:ABC-type branched-subunit amino acid transport system substrate-binding protein